MRLPHCFVPARFAKLAFAAAVAGPLVACGLPQATLSSAEPTYTRMSVCAQIPKPPICTPMTGVAF